MERSFCAQHRARAGPAVAARPRWDRTFHSHPGRALLCAPRLMRTLTFPQPPLTTV